MKSNSSRSIHFSSNHFDLAIIGAGIVGLATARAILRHHPGVRLAIVEKESTVASHQTAHNSGVVHSGVYYKPGSLKASMCATGARAMAAFCRDEGLPLQALGKVIVARHASEVSTLDEIECRGRANGIAGVRRLSPEALKEIEPAIEGIAALHLPDVAIVDYAAVARRYADHIRAAGGEIATGTELICGQSRAEGIVLETTQGTIKTRVAVNCGGLQADRIWAKCGGQPDAAVLPFRGEYYQLAPAAAAQIRGLVYPVPDARFPFLGVHFTPRVQGGVEAGPNAVLSWAREGYAKLSWKSRDAFDLLRYRGFWAMAARYWRKGMQEQYRSLSRPAFIRSLQELMPGLGDDQVMPGGAGVRAQVVQRNGKLMDDFHVVREGGFLHVINVPSPAATASLVIGDYLADQVAECI